MQRFTSRLIDLGLLGLVKDSKSHKKIFDNGNKILSLVDLYEKSLLEDDEVGKKCALDEIKSEYMKPYGYVASHIICKLGLYHLIYML